MSGFSENSHACRTRAKSEAAAQRHNDYGSLRHSASGCTDSGTKRAQDAGDQDSHDQNHPAV